MRHHSGARSSLAVDQIDIEVERIIGQGRIGLGALFGRTLPFHGIILQCRELGGLDQLKRTLRIVRARIPGLYLGNARGNGTEGGLAR